MKNGHLLVATDPLLSRKVCRVIGTNAPLRSSLNILRRTPLGRTSQNFPSTHSVELGLLASKDVMHRTLLAHESPEPAQDDPSEGSGKLTISSLARCSRQLHIDLRLLAQYGREADLRCVVSSYSARLCNSRISKPLPLLSFARCCTVLRSRWYQSGIKWHRYSTE